MFAFPGMIAPAAKKAGMKTPVDPDDFDGNEFPHFFVYCNLQLGRPMVFPGEHWENAKVVAAIPDDWIRSVTLEQMIERGFQYRS
jgi:hypothetical protein